MEEEHATFLRYAETTKINSAFFDHTGSGDTHYAVRLNGSESERIGLAKSLAVMTGDTVRAEVFAKYLDPDPSHWTAALHDLMAAVPFAGARVSRVLLSAVRPPIWSKLARFIKKQKLVQCVRLDLFVFCSIYGNNRLYLSKEYFSTDEPQI